MGVFPKKILLATDGSENAALAAKKAVELADEVGAELHVLHVAEPPRMFLASSELDPQRAEQEARDTLAEAVRRIEAEGGKVAETHLRLGGVAESIVHLGEELHADLIVVGSRGASIWKRAVMGSVSEDVVRHAHCPVLVVREEEPRV